MTEFLTIQKETYFSGKKLLFIAEKIREDREKLFAQKPLYYRVGYYATEILMVAGLLGGMATLGASLFSAKYLTASAICGLSLVVGLIGSQFFRKFTPVEDKLLTLLETSVRWGSMGGSLYSFYKKELGQSLSKVDRDFNQLRSASLLLQSIRCIQSKSLEAGKKLAEAVLDHSQPHTRTLHLAIKLMNPSKELQEKIQNIKGRVQLSTLDKVYEMATA